MFNLTKSQTESQASASWNGKYLIQLKDIEKCFDTRAGKLFALRRITFDVRPGEFLTLMGPSGSGKTTLLNIIGLLDGQWSGEYFFEGHPVHSLKPKERQNLNRQNFGIVFQNFNLLESLTVYENLDLPLSYRNIKPAERATKVCEILDRFQIVGKKDLYANQLSGGQQQLVGIARAVITNPKVILADEPTGNLHSKQGEEIMEMFSRLNQEGTTIIQVTHSDKNAEYGQRIIRLSDGWMEEEGQQS